MLLILVQYNDDQLRQNNGIFTCVASVGEILHAVHIWKIGKGEVFETLVVGHMFGVNVDGWLSVSPTFRTWEHIPVRGAVF